MLSYKKTRFLKKILPYVVIFQIGGFLYLFIERGIMGELKQYPSTGNSYSFWISLLTLPSISALMSITVGILEEYVFKNLLRKKSFLLKILLKNTLYVFIIFTVIVIASMVPNILLWGFASDQSELVAPAVKFASDFSILSVITYCGAIIGVSLFFSEMVDYIGLNATTNFITGKYSESKVEDRVFMFLDMKSSTTIAEKLGHERYYQLLNTYYMDMTSAIISTRGEIYQYVGDEIVLSWQFARGIEDSNCLRCFFLIKDQMKKRCEYYENKFGVFPEFKAGLHYGKVTTGEVGIIKKEILFTGDVLNTTARIQGLCNEQGTDLLISEDLKTALDIEERYELLPKGSFELRGRDQKIKLFAAERKRKADSN